MSTRPCTCPHGVLSLGVRYGVNLNGRHRLDTAPGCPEHDSCHGWTEQRRAERPAWSNPYCPIHGTKNCPTEESDDRTA